jgi:dihydropteroate synthase
MMRLIEPLGLLQGAAAQVAIASGLALPLHGGRMGYTLARLIAKDDAPRSVAVNELPDEWRDVAEKLAAPVPDWAGLGGGAVIMGIINVTPDSFSDGGDYFDAGRAAEAGQAMVAAGAAILDIGGESTRPDESRVISSQEEQRRVLPVISALRDCGATISVDTRNAATMGAALDAGAAIVNDVSGLTHDPEAARLVARRGCPVVVMHMRGTPQTMNTLADYTDVAVEVTRELASRVAAAEAAGVARAQIAVDPGIGFAKRTGQNREVLVRLPLLLNIGCPILVGLSRKRFVREVTRTLSPKQTGPGSLAGVLYSLWHGARILRVHEVADTVQAVRVWEVLSGAVERSISGVGDVH